jgi:hypothetical protein
MDPRPAVSIQHAIQPVFLFGQLPIHFLADFQAGGRCSVPPDDKPGTLAILLPPIPPGCIIGFIPPEVAAHVRPMIQKEKDKGAEFVWIDVNNVRVFIYCDLPLGGQPMFTEGMGALGKPIRTHAVPRGSILAVFMPELADQVRKGMNAAIAAARKAEIAGQNGSVVGS